MTADLISFYASKIFWVVLAPSHLLILILLASLMLRPTIFKDILQAFAILVMSFCVFLPVGEWVTLPLEQCFAETPPPMEDIDGIVVLGGAVDPRVSIARREVDFNSAADRVTAMLKLMHQYPDKPVIYSGGSGVISDDSFDEATMVRDYVKSVGEDTSRVLVEGKSRNTYENALFSTALMELRRGQNWYLVTSAAHMPRAMTLFEKVGKERGITFHPYSTDYKTIGWYEIGSGFSMPISLEHIDGAVKEYAGLVINKLLGKTDRIWPCSPPPPEPKPEAP